MPQHQRVHCRHAQLPRQCGVHRHARQLHVCLPFWFHRFWSDVHLPTRPCSVRCWSSFGMPQHQRVHYRHAQLPCQCGVHRHARQLRVRLHTWIYWLWNRVLQHQRMHCRHAQLHRQWGVHRHARQHHVCLPFWFHRSNVHLSIGLFGFGHYKRFRLP